MSYQYKRADVRVVVCDMCGDFSWIGDRHWREMPERSGEQPIHLCRACQHVALWCSAHQEYHRPDMFHRRACVDCGGLFTSIVREALTRCPACRRAVSDTTARPAPQSVEQPRSLIQMLFSSRASHRP
jgi:uncharacterized protein with PIN domain